MFGFTITPGNIILSIYFCKKQSCQVCFFATLKKRLIKIHSINNSWTTPSWLPSNYRWLFLTISRSHQPLPTPTLASTTMPTRATFPNCQGCSSRATLGQRRWNITNGVNMDRSCRARSSVNLCRQHKQRLKLHKLRQLASIQRVLD